MPQRREIFYSSDVDRFGAFRGNIQDTREKFDGKPLARILRRLSALYFPLVLRR